MICLFQGNSPVIELGRLKDLCMSLPLRELIYELWYYSQLFKVNHIMDIGLRIHGILALQYNLRSEVNIGYYM